MMMVENHMMDTIDEEEVSYTEEELEAIYREYQERVVKKYEFKIMCKKLGIV